jgi:hypothetical protein
MRSSITASIDERTMKVVSALMEQRGISRSEALNFLAWQGVLRLKELNADQSEESAEVQE